MNVNEALGWARGIMDAHGLEGWDLSLEDNEFELGRTNSETHEIFISKQYAEWGDEELFRDTILHEMAHALIPKRPEDPVWRREYIESQGHTAEWKDCAARLGVKNISDGADVNPPWTLSDTFLSRFHLRQFKYLLGMEQEINRITTRRGRATF